MSSNIDIRGLGRKNLEERKVVLDWQYIFV